MGTVTKQRWSFTNFIVTGFDQNQAFSWGKSRLLRNFYRHFVTDILPDNYSRLEIRPLDKLDGPGKPNIGFFASSFRSRFPVSIKPEIFSCVNKILMTTFCYSEDHTHESIYKLQYNVAKFMQEKENQTNIKYKKLTCNKLLDIHIKSNQHKSILTVTT